MITMIQASDIYSFVEGQLTDTPYFLVAVDQPEADSFAVAIDSAAPADIDSCAPVRVRGQYIKNLGKEIEVLTNAGRKLRGPLSAVDADTFTVDVTEKRKEEGAKRPVEITEQVTVPFADVKYAKLILKF